MFNYTSSLVVDMYSQCTYMIYPRKHFLFLWLLLLLCLPTHTLTHTPTRTHSHSHTQRLKSSSSVAPNLLSQISAYQGNFFHVESLIEDSKTKADALAAVEQTKSQMAEVCTVYGVDVRILRMADSACNVCMGEKTVE